jgi:hypothetical protein
MRKARVPRRTSSKVGVRRRKAETPPPRVLTTEQFERLAERLEKRGGGDLTDFLAELDDSAWLVDGARARNVYLASWLINKLVVKLRNSQPLQEVERDFLADALAKIIKSPTKAAQALGLVAPKARPSKGISERDWSIHKCVQSYLKAGIPFKDGSPTKEWDGDGAVTRAAAEQHVSTSTVKRRYSAVRKLNRLWEPRMEVVDELLESI